jgi:hypothetical protein
LAQRAPRAFLANPAAARLFVEQPGWLSRGAVYRILNALKETSGAYSPEQEAIIRLIEQEAQS